MRLLSALLCLLPLALSAVEDQPPASNPLAGTTWAITLVSSEGDKTDDVLTITGTTLASQAYAESRFIPGPVTVTGTAEAYTIVATLAEPRGRELSLTGKVVGTAITGTITVGVRGQCERSTFSGTKK